MEKITYTREQLEGMNMNELKDVVIEIQATLPKGYIKKKEIIKFIMDEIEKGDTENQLFITMGIDKVYSKRGEDNMFMTDNELDRKLEEILAIGEEENDFETGTVEEVEVNRDMEFGSVEEAEYIDDILSLATNDEVKEAEIIEEAEQEDVVEEIEQAEVIEEVSEVEETESSNVIQLTLSGNNIEIDVDKEHYEEIEGTEEVEDIVEEVEAIEEVEEVEETQPKNEYSAPEIEYDEKFDMSSVPITMIPIEELVPSAMNFFKPLNEEKFNELVDSIKANGILVPLIARPQADGRLEILAGHNRVMAGQKAGLKEFPTRVVRVDDEKAKEILIDTNVTQRLEMTPMEIARAYDEKARLLGNRQGKRTDLIGGKSNNEADKAGATRDLIGQQYGKSGMTIERYMRLNNLTEDFQAMVDNGKIAVKTGTELGLLNRGIQSNLLRVAEESVEGIKAISTGKVTAIKKAVKDKAKEENMKPEDIVLTRDEIRDIIFEDLASSQKPLKFTVEVPADYDQETREFVEGNILTDPQWVLKLIEDYAKGKLVFQK